MPEKSMDYANFPWGKLPTNINRRQFIADVINEIRTVRPDKSAHPVFKLSDLGDMPDDTLARIKPILIPGCQVTQHDEAVWGKAAASQKETCLFPLDSPAAAILTRFSGQNSLENISRDIAARYQWDTHHAFAYVRGVFLWLVTRKLAAPKMEGRHV